MVKVRLMGTTNDIKWYRKRMDKDKGIRVMEHSEILPMSNTDRFRRAYSKVERVKK